ncbi:hypothetical protein BaRGS_00002881 [Batillaria attramentaria]|uniref:C2H2-type domain-containing protein n=1 Tax=Batillaria attramentaria TaxID=370345 RepID=A0ABD0M107_9CAEN
MDASTMDPSLLNIQGFEAGTCCVCLKNFKTRNGSPRWMQTADNLPVGVCSLRCEQNLLFSSGFTKGFVLCCILSHLLGKLGSNWRTSHYPKSDASSDGEGWLVANGQLCAAASEMYPVNEDLNTTVGCDADNSAGHTSPKYDSPPESFPYDTAEGVRDEQIITRTTRCKSKNKDGEKGKQSSVLSARARRGQGKQTQNKDKLLSYRTLAHCKAAKQRETLKQRLKVQKRDKISYKNKSGGYRNKNRDSLHMYMCTCGKSLRSEKLYIQHRQACHSDSQNISENQSRTVSCHLCARDFQSKWHLNYHLRRKHSGETSVECDICGKMLSGMFDLNEHKRKAHSINYLCHACGRKFFSSNALAGHLATHTGVKSYFCEECGAGFVRKTSLSNHQALHVKVSAFLCDICSQSFKTRTRLYDHMMNVHHCGPYFDNRVRRLKTMGITVDREAISRLASGLCTVCGEKLDGGGKCLSHSDANEEVFKCTLCGKAESDIVSLFYHSKWHRGEDTSSTVTDISFPSHGLLNYECKTCFKKFKNKNYLIKHMQQHKEKRFSCDVCGKSFTYKCNLKSHLTTHSQNRPFECEFCRKAFKLKYTLDVHRKNHCREVDAFKCDICGKGLIRKESLEKHYKMVHPDSKPSFNGNNTVNDTAC